MATPTNVEEYLAALPEQRRVASKNFGGRSGCLRIRSARLAGVSLGRRPMLRLRILGALLLAGLATGAFAGTTTACSAAWSPSPAYIAAHADVIVLARITSMTEVLSQPDPVDLQVLRVIKGDPEASLHVERPQLGICGDDLGLLKAGIGSRVVLTTDVEGIDGSTLTPAWIERPGGWWVGDPTFRSLAALLAALDSPLPDTSTAPGTPAAASPGLLLGLLSGALAAFAFSRLGRSRAN